MPTPLCGSAVCLVSFSVAASCSPIEHRYGQMRRIVLRFPDGIGFLSVKFFSRPEARTPGQDPGMSSGHALPVGGSPEVSSATCENAAPLLPQVPA